MRIMAVCIALTVVTGWSGGECLAATLYWSQDVGRARMTGWDRDPNIVLVESQRVTSSINNTDEVVNGNTLGTRAVWNYNYPQCGMFDAADKRTWVATVDCGIEWYRTRPGSYSNHWFIGVWPLLNEAYLGILDGKGRKWTFYFSSSVMGGIPPETRNCTATKRGDIDYGAVTVTETNGKLAQTEIELKCTQDATVKVQFMSAAGTGTTQLANGLTVTYQVGVWPGVGGFTYRLQGGIPSLAKATTVLGGSIPPSAGPFSTTGVVRLSYE